MTYPTNQIPSINPQNIGVATPIGLQSATRDPTAQDNTFVPGWEWQNTSTGMFFKCVSSTISGAVWEPFIPNSSGTVSTLTGNSGGVVGPDGSGNINVIGDVTTIDVTGIPGTNTLTVSLVGGGVASQSYVTNVGGPVAPTVAGIIDLSASTSTYTDGSVANTIKTEIQGTNHALFVGRGALTPATTIATGTSGKPLISAGAGSDPAFGTLGISGGGTNATSFAQANGIVTYNGTSLVNYAGPQISATGVQTNSLQPCFCVVLVGTTSAVTGDGTGWVFGTTGGITPTVQFDQTSSISTVLGNITFTVPVTGKYLFYANFDITNLTAAMTRCNFEMNNGTTGGLARFQRINIGAIRTDQNEANVQGSALIDCIAGETWTVGITIYNGTKAATIAGAATFLSYWSGYLLC